MLSTAADMLACGWMFEDESFEWQRVSRMRKLKAAWELKRLIEGDVG